MLCRIVLLTSLLMGAGSASAQTLEGYVTGGAGHWSHNTGSSGELIVGAAGLEWLPSPQFGIAGEGGLLTSLNGDLAATVGVDARVHFNRSPEPGQWAPYAFVGYSPLRFFELSDQGVSFGGGVDYRLSPRRALRFEVRDILRSSGSVDSHYLTARVGLTFR